MTILGPRLRRRQLLQAGAAAAGALILPGTGAGARRRQAAVRHDAEYRVLELALCQALDRIRPAIRRGDRRQGQLRDAVLPDLQSAHRCRVVDRRFVLRRAQRHLHLYRPLDRRRLVRSRSIRTSRIRRRRRPIGNPSDFLPGTTAAFKDASGKLYAIPWTADIYMAGAARYDLFEKAGKAMPDTFDEVADDDEGGAHEGRRPRLSSPKTTTVGASFPGCRASAATSSATRRRI